LVARTTNLSTTAQALTRRDPCYHGPNDCGQVTSSGVASARFPGGVSYTSEQVTFFGRTFYTSAFDTYVVPVSGRSTPYDTFTVTAHGGPSTAGDDDTGRLSAAVEPQTGAAGRRSVVLQGDTVGTLSKVSSFGMRDTYLEGDGGITGPVLLWAFGTDGGNSYDVASFDVSYTRYVLP
jgi:hypothetical protein